MEMTPCLPNRHKIYISPPDFSEPLIQPPKQLVAERTEQIVHKKAEMEKVTKQHQHNFEPEKLAHKICAKNAHNRAKISKNDKNCTTKGKNH